MEKAVVGMAEAAAPTEVVGFMGAAVIMEVSAGMADLGMGAVSVVGMVPTTDEVMDGVPIGTGTDTDTDMAVR